MKNYLFKGLLALFTVVALGSCTKETLDVGTDHPPMVEADDVQINLTLADVEQNMPPQTRAMPEGGDSKFDESLIAIVFAEIASSQGKYKYYSVRPVVKGTGTNNFKLSLPGTLIGRQVRLHVYSNSMDILTPNIYTRFTRDVTTEEQVIAALTLTTQGRWNVDATAYKRIPMYGKSDFTLLATTATLPPISLLRMMARVDVGLNYNNTTESATPGTLNNFKIMHMFVYNTNNIGQLIAGASSLNPTVPEGVRLIPAYQSFPQNNVTNSIIRDVFLFEHKNDGTVFASNRPCIILYGDYCPDPVANPTVWAKGYYRIDFYKGGNYLNITRNTLYRFDIKSVSGVGHLRVEDALDNVASNVVINLQSYAMGHNETEFNGQDYLSVNKSTLTIYTDRRTDNFTVKTSYLKGWNIDGLTGVFSNNNFTPNSENKANNTETVVTFNFTGSTYPTTGTHEFLIKAGNLEKKMYINVIAGPAPDVLKNFSIPPVLYFARAGGNSLFNVTTNITRASFNFVAGQIKHGTIPGQAIGNGTVVPFTLTINPTTVPTTGNNSSILGSLQVNVLAGNADLSASSKIIQFTDPKELSVYMEPIPATGSLSQRMYYVLPDAPTAGITTNNHRYYVVNAENLVSSANTITAPNGATGFNFVNIPANNTYKERDYFRFTVYPTVTTSATSLDTKIDIIGHKPPVVVVKQAAAPEPTFTTSSSTIDYNNPKAKVTVSNGSNVQDGFVVKYKAGDIFGDDAEVSLAIPNNIGQTVDVPTSYNRGDTRTATVKVFAVGYNRVLMPVEGKSLLVTQSGATRSDYTFLVPPEDATVSSEATQHTFKFTNMEVAHMFEAKMGELEQGSITFTPYPTTGNIAYKLGESEATYTVTFAKNTTKDNKTARFRFSTHAINRNSQPMFREYSVTLTQQNAETHIKFDLKQDGADENPILKPYRLSNTYYIPKVSVTNNIKGAKLQIREGSTTGDVLSTKMIYNNAPATIVIPDNSNATTRALFLVAVDDDNHIYQSQRLEQQKAINKHWGGIQGETLNYKGQCDELNYISVNNVSYRVNDSRLPRYYEDFLTATNYQHTQKSSSQFWYYYMDKNVSPGATFAYVLIGEETRTSSSGLAEYNFYRCLAGTLGEANN